MSKISKKLRRAIGLYFHWCPACEMMHPLPDNWTFEGSFESPTFHPSFRQLLGNGKVCHYNIVSGVIVFAGDCTHALARKNVPMPDLPGPLCPNCGAESTDGYPVEKLECGHFQCTYCSKDGCTDKDCAI